VLLAFGCLRPGVGEGQQAPIFVTIQSPPTEATAQIAQQSPVALENLVTEAMQKNPGIRERSRSGGRSATPCATGKNAARPHGFCGLGGQHNAVQRATRRPFELSRGDCQPSNTLSRKVETTWIVKRPAHLEICRRTVPISTQARSVDVREPS
jgi:hypothetical protein